MTARANWRDDAACRDADPELFFPAGTAGPALRQIGEAKRICRACPARTQCLAWALDNGITDGVWGGATEDERRAIRRLRRRMSTSQEDADGESCQPAEPGPAGMLPRLRTPACQRASPCNWPRACTGRGTAGSCSAGHRPRLLRLNPAAARLLRPGRFAVTDRTSAALAGRLVDIGLAHPRPSACPVRDVTIVIPVRDRAAELGRLLARLRADPDSAGLPVLATDDGSADPAAVAAVAEAHGAMLFVHPDNRGPAAARNTGIRRARTACVALCDSDVRPGLAGSTRCWPSSPTRLWRCPRRGC